MMRALIILLMCAARSCFAVLIDGRNMSMEDAIMRASVNGSNTKIFELMQDENSVLVELDMQFTIKDYADIRRGMSMPTSGARRKRKALRALSYRWTNQQVPYEISNEFSSYDRQLISAAMDDYHKYTCIRFVPATSSDVNKVRFVNGGGCSSYVGMIGGTQLLTLAPGCRYKGIIIHEMGHAVGFQHEQTRPDRDSHVSIRLENIQRGLDYNFMRYDTAQVNTYEVPYDYSSVMHYSQYAFSINGNPTIVAKDSRYQTEMGNREGFSFNDIRLANLMYDCAVRSGCQQRQCPAGGFQAKDCKCYCDSGSRSNPLVDCSTTPVAVSTTTSTTASTKPTVTTAIPTATRISNGTTASTATRPSNSTTTSTATRPSNGTTAIPTVTRPSNSTTASTATRPSNGTTASNRTSSSTVTTSTTIIRTIATQTSNSTTLSITTTTAKISNSTTASLTTTTAKINQTLCQDLSPYCPAWAEEGYCTGQHTVYMMSNCKRSCHYCGTTTTKAPITTTAPICKDETMYCSTWAKAGECSRNPSYMNNYCRKSCNICGTVTPSPACHDLNTICSHWKSYCTHETYREFLRLNCRRTCQYC